MADSLVIVESPAKAKTINKYLGKNFVVTSSVGHIKDLPKSKIGIDIENNFKPEYVVIRGKSKVISEIKKLAENKKNIYLAPDPDREGEAIAWHIANELKSKKDNIYRITFNEITKSAVKYAIEHPGQIDINRVNAQQTRRILDRLVGYKISPLLWRKLFTGLSAGRVQSVALKIICDREQEILDFQTKEYWSVKADLKTLRKDTITAALTKKNNKKIEIPDQKTADSIVKELEKEQFVIKDITRQKKQRRPYAPFITSTLQQEAARHYYFNANKTMRTAQTLYEGVSIGSTGSTGLITYMRTDSTRIADSAVSEARKFIANQYGSNYLPPKPVKYLSKKSAQDAHEAIRPTSPSVTPESIKQYLSAEQFKLYSLIWKRFIACQMKNAIISQTSVDISAGKYLFRVTGSVISFQGYMKLYTEKSDNDNDNNKENQSNNYLPELNKNEILELIKLLPKQHFTQPPPRYSEATLIKILEEKGIGRPSTYAAIMYKIQDKNYTTKIKGKFHPTELGLIVIHALTDSFAHIMNEKFTAEMESDLDNIEKGSKNWTDILKQFYEYFDKELQEALKSMQVKPVETDIPCEKCGKLMVVRWSRKGGFLSCSGYPECKHTMSYTKDEQGKIIAQPPEEPEETGEICECGKPMVIRSSKYGKFLACSGYPQCKKTRSIDGSSDGKNSKQPKLIDEKCPKCDSQLVERSGKYGTFYACSNFPKCRYIKPEESNVKCPEQGCDGHLIKRKGKRGKPFYGCSNYPKCSFTAKSLEGLKSNDES
ncbi:type I DNA topoisomerase [bacterium]|nr:type I DNA topoisomerase [bacterium]